MNPKSIISRSLLASTFAAVLAFSTTTAHAQIPQNGLVAHYKFEDDVTDTIGSFNGTIQGGGLTFPIDTPPSIDSAQSARFDGTDDFVRINNGILTNYGADYTAAAWFKAEIAPSGSTRLVIFESQDFLISFGLREDPSNMDNTQVQFFTNTTVVSDPNIVISVPDNEIEDVWNHAAVVYDASSTPHGELRVYLNGVLRGNRVLDDPLDLDPEPGFFNIGTFRSANGRFFQGNLDDVAIWDRALAPEEIMAINNPTLDVNNDFAIGITDVAAIRSAILFDPNNLNFDVNGDEMVDGSDIVTLLTSFEPLFDSFVTVTNTNDSGAGSLREALSSAQASPGTQISFSSSVAGETIQLTSGALVIDSAQEVVITGGDSGVTIDAGGNSRIFTINPGARVALENLTLTGGVASRISSSSDDGGAIFNNNATLSLSVCTLCGNSAEDDGGGIFNSGQGGSATLSLSACTLSGNSATSGGGIFNNGRAGSATLSLSACTLSGNSATFGGGIFNEGRGGGSSSATLGLSACTISGNSAIGGGGIFHIGTNISAKLSLSDTILAENTARDGPDLREIDRATTTATGSNLISSLDGQTSLTEDDVTLLTTPLALAPLGDYGGPTQTRPPLPGSPAIDTAGTTNPGGTDQRGFPRFFSGMLDIGAVEFQGEEGELDLTFDLDSDGDGSSNGVELAIGTEPTVFDSTDERNLRLTDFNDSGEPTFTFGFDISQQDNIILSLVRSTDLVDFSEVIMSNETENFLDPGMDLLQLDDTAPPAEGKAFYRLEAERRLSPE